MVEAAERLAARARGDERGVSRSSTARAIDLPEASVDGVLSRFGYILQGRPAAGARARSGACCRPGGRLAFAVWAARERNPWMTVPADAMVERGHLASADDRGEPPLGPPQSRDDRAACWPTPASASPTIEEMPVTLPLRRRRRALVLRQRAPRAGRARTRRARRRRTSAPRSAPRSNPAHPHRRRLRARRRQPERRVSLATMRHVRRLGRVVR